jgi:hypothetical protein
VTCHPYTEFKLPRGPPAVLRPCATEAMKWNGLTLYYPNAVGR